MKLSGMFPFVFCVLRSSCCSPVTLFCLFLSSPGKAPSEDLPEAPASTAFADVKSSHPRPAPHRVPVQYQDRVWHDNQRTVAAAVVQKIVSALELPAANNDTRKAYPGGVDFMVVLPNMRTLEEQTRTRVQRLLSEELGVDRDAADHVMRRMKSQDLETLLQRAKQRDVLFLLFVDECHWGAKLGQCVVC